MPAVISGSWLNKPAILHEQNAVLGRANRWLVARAAVVATSFHATLGADGRDQQVERTGNPVRAAILAHRTTHFVAPVGGDVIRLFIFGGSLGARVFSDLVPAALIHQLKPGGRMVIPAGIEEAQQLMIVDKAADGRIDIREALPVRFSPLITDDDL